MDHASASIVSRPFELGPRRAIFVPVSEVLGSKTLPAGVPRPNPELIADLERYDILYRALCAVLYNFVPTSGHPGGSISSGRIVASILFAGLDYDFSQPDDPTNDVLVYAAGHKAMGLYAMWALRNEVVRTGAPALLPRAERHQLRLEDLLGFRRNPTNRTPLFASFRAKALDGHPTPATPGVRVATGASGVGVPAAIGLALGAIDTYGPDSAPQVHLLEGEGGMTPGRVSEALATAATAGLSNATMHVDWNQASIDSNRVCRDGDQPGEYVQWNPVEFTYLHDWNVYKVDDGHDLRQILTAIALARLHPNDQPSAIIYRTVKGFRYGMEGRVSHGAGHKFCTDGYYEALAECEKAFGVKFPRHEGEKTPEAIERTFWNTLLVFRKVIEKTDFAPRLAARLGEQKAELARRARRPRADAPDLQPLYGSEITIEPIPENLVLAPGSESTLRAALGDALGHVNRATRGAIIGAAADLLGSTSVANLNKGFGEGFYHARRNPQTRLIAGGGICEDSIGALLGGLSSSGNHIGVGSSYAAFIAALEHVAARLHGIGQQARHETFGDPFRAFIMTCAHAGLKTGEDGPTHADPQALQLVQENFPNGVCITLTPWEPQELWPLLIAGLKARPAVLAPFVTRPNEKVPDRTTLSIPPATAAAKGIYALRSADPATRPYHGTIVLQESGVVYAFVDDVLPALDRDGFRMNIYVVTSPGLFDRLPAAERELIFPAARAREAMAITGFTMPTMYRWVTSDEGRMLSLHAFAKGRYLGSGQAHKVLEEAGLDGAAQYQAVRRYIQAFARGERNEQGPRLVVEAAQH